MLEMTKRNIALIGLIQIAVICIGTFWNAMFFNVATRDMGVFPGNLMKYYGDFGLILLILPVLWGWYSGIFNTREILSPKKQTLCMLLGIIIPFILSILFAWPALRVYFSIHWEIGA